MVIELLPALQIFTDLALLCAIIFLLRLVNKKINKESVGIDKKSLEEFKKLIKESRDSSDYLFHALNEGRKSFKEIAYALDEKEKRLKFFLETADSKFKDIESDRGEKYKEVIRLAKQDLSEKEIAHVLHLTEGEICLILNLDRKRNENA
ncbi:MAG: hypothetical protein GWP10_16450 [Nitrospiraceae bacterium]|nr:hypothetical protein [Nitrospiraceae bacterium]